MNGTSDSIMQLIFLGLLLVAAAAGFRVAGSIPVGSEPWVPWAIEFALAAGGSLLLMLLTVFVITRLIKR